MGGEGGTGRVGGGEGEMEEGKGAGDTLPLRNSPVALDSSSRLAFLCVITTPTFDIDISIAHQSISEEKERKNK